MLRLKPKDILFKSFDRVFGLGLSSSFFYCSFFGFNKSMPIKIISKKKQEIIFYFCRLFWKKQLIDLILKMHLRHIYSWLLHDKLYVRGFRHFYGYPVRGQHTQCNAKTVKKMKRNFLKT